MLHSLPIVRNPFALFLVFLTCAAMCRPDCVLCYVAWSESLLVATQCHRGEVYELGWHQVGFSDQSSQCHVPALAVDNSIAEKKQQLSIF
jgi:hypothetical protein